MTKARPNIIPHDSKTGISSPSLPAPDRGRVWPNTDAGSGSRPVPSKAPVASSAPADARTLDRAPPGWLGSDKPGSRRR
jgi:hypothetical protein